MSNLRQSSLQSLGAQQRSGKETTPDVAVSSYRQSARDKARMPQGSRQVGFPTRVRTRLACDACRRRRTKCNGSQPICQGCAASGRTCVYADHKRTRDRQQMSYLKSTLEQYEQLLRDLVHEAPPSAAKRISSILTLANISRLDRKPSLCSSSSASAESLEGIDTIDEDLNRTEESRATGFMGKNSVHTWMHRLESETSQCSLEERNKTTSRSRMNQSRSPQSLDSHQTNTSYFLDDKQLPTLKLRDPSGLPPRNRADQILWHYFKYIHPCFPIVRADLFSKQYKSLWLASNPRPGRKWLAILNMVLAISCRQLQFLHKFWPADESDSIYFSRARDLSVNESWVLEHADLQQVQLEALTTLYFMVCMQINRAWKACGIAVRSAMALAINLRNTDTRLPPASQEARSRLWWSIFMLENLLLQMTGRPTCIGSSSFSVRPPIPFTEDLFNHPQVMRLLNRENLGEYLSWSLDDEQESAEHPRPPWLETIEPNQGLHFFYLVDLMHTAHTAVGELYSPTGFQASRSYIKSRIRFYDEKLNRWLSRLHPAYRFVDDHGKLYLRKPSQEQIVLALNYYSVKITLHRPCSPFRTTAVQDKEYTNNSQRCLDAALSLMAVFPDVVDVEWVYRLSPWWCSLHFLMQAATILIISSRRIKLGIFEHVANSFESHDAKGWALQIQNDCRKANSWLHGLSSIDESFRRAYLRFTDLSRLLILESSTSPTPESMHNPPFGTSHDVESAGNGPDQKSDETSCSIAHDTLAEGEIVSGQTSRPEIQQPIDWANGNAFVRSDAVDFGDILPGIIIDLMSDNFMHVIKAALEDEEPT